MHVSSDSINEERTVQMTFIDHVSDPDSLKTATPVIVPENICERVKDCWMRHVEQS